MDVDRKRTEEGRQKIFQNKVCEKVARYVVRRQSTSYLYPNTASAPADLLTKENSQHNGNTIKYLKSPSVERNAGDFQTQTDWLSNSDEQIHVKNAVVKAEAKTVAY